MNNKFGSGPCAKFAALAATYKNEYLGRSHRSAAGLKKIQQVMALIKTCLKIPENYKLAIIGGGNTGATETLIWTLVGERGIDVLQYGVFSKYWANDIINELNVKDVRIFESQYWTLEHKEKVDFNRDLAFCWTETTTGVSVNNVDWIPDDRKGLVICDATAAVYCEDIDWNKLDAVSFSWQKGLGGEAGLGCVVLSPRAIERLRTFIPKNRPIPRLYRIAKNGEINFGIFEGKTINTPSMLSIEDYEKCLKFAIDSGGLDFLLERVAKNYNAAKSILKTQSRWDFIVKDENFRAKNVICLDLLDENYQSLSEEEKWNFLRKIAKDMEDRNIACDILGHIWTKPHIRIWAGPTIETDDLERVINALIAYRL